LRKDHHSDDDDKQVKTTAATELARHEVREFFTDYDVKRLQAYAQELVDFHLIMDLLPAVSRFYFLDRFGSTKLSPTQAQIFVAMGLQYKTVEEAAVEMEKPETQLLALFNKAIRKICKFLRTMQEDEAKNELENTDPNFRTKKLQAEGDDNADDDDDDARALEAKRAQQKILKELNLSQYTIKGDEEEWQGALKDAKNPSSVSLSRGTKSSNSNNNNNSSNSNIINNKPFITGAINKGRFPKRDASDSRNNRGGGKGGSGRAPKRFKK